MGGADLIAAYFSPTSFTRIAPHVTLLLTIIMFAMGVTLSFADFRRVFTRPAPVIAGIGLHYLVMPLAAWGIARLLRMPPDLTAAWCWSAAWQAARRRT